MRPGYKQGLYFHRLDALVSSNTLHGTQNIQISVYPVHYTEPRIYTIQISLYSPTHYTEPRIYRYLCIQYITRSLEYTDIRVSSIHYTEPRIYRYPCIQFITLNLEYTDILVSSTLHGIQNIQISLYLIHYTEPRIYRYPCIQGALHGTQNIQISLIQYITRNPENLILLSLQPDSINLKPRDFTEFIVKDI